MFIVLFELDVLAASMMQTHIKIYMYVFKIKMFLKLSLCIYICSIIDMHLQMYISSYPLFTIPIILIAYNVSECWQQMSLFVFVF